MDWLKRLGGFLGGVGNQAQRTVGGIVGGVNQAAQQAQRAFRPLAQQVQRSLPRLPAIPKVQLPVIPKIQVPAIPKIQLPPTPKINLNDFLRVMDQRGQGAASAANIIYRTATGQKLAPNQQQLLRTPQVKQALAFGKPLAQIPKAIQPLAEGIIKPFIGITQPLTANEISAREYLANPEKYPGYQKLPSKPGMTDMYQKPLKAKSTAQQSGQLFNTSLNIATLGKNPLGGFATSPLKTIGYNALEQGVAAGVGGVAQRYGDTGNVQQAFNPASVGIDVGGGAVLGGLFATPSALKFAKGNKAISTIGNQAKLQNLATTKPLTRTIGNDYTGPLSKMEPPKLPQVGKTAPLEALKAEARKYKSADEFVASQGKPLYHGTNSQFDKYDPNIARNNGEMGGNLWGFGQYTSPNIGTAKNYGKNVMEYYGKPKNPLDLSKFKTKQELADHLDMSEDAIVMLNGTPTASQSQAAQFSSHARDAGYDAIVGNKGQEIVLLDNSSLITKQQLTDLYNQAKAPQVGKGIEEQLRSKYPNSQFDVFDSGKNISVSRIVVDKSARNTGTGTKAMQDIIDYADKNGKRVTLTPSSDFGGSKSRLVDFYKRFGFVENKGRTKDLGISDTMYRSPSKPTKAPQPGKTDLPSMYGKGQIGSDVPESYLRPKAPKVPVKAAAEETLLKESGIAKSLEKSGSKIYADIPGYIPVKNKALLNISENRVALDERAVINSIVNRQPNQPVTPQMNADSVYLLNKLLKEGRDDEALAIAKATAKNATSAGRAVQILSRLQQTTPEGALVKAQKIVNEVNDKAGKQIVTLDAKNQEDIIALANQVQKYKPDTREYQKAAGELMKYIENLKPVSRGAKVSMIQTMAQLLNPKTAIRNVVGNLGMSGGEDIASIPAALLDKIVSVKTGIRTTSISNPIVGVKGAIKGFKYGVEDTKLGIKTLGSQTKFDIRPDVFKKGIMKKLQNALGYELGVPDKAFYQSAFDKTLDSVMRANKTKTPTAEMLDIANAEALYATFQNNSAIGNALQKTKGVLNLGKDFGAGDFIIKYPKTPGNIVSVGLDYSPIGIGKGITSLARNLSSMTPSVQREAVRNIGRGITGTGAIAMGVILAQNGIITGRKDSDKDIAALDREQGMGPFTFNATALLRLAKGEDTKVRPGDVVANYDWLQPAAIQLSMGANAVLNVGKGTDNLIGDALESIGDSANTVVEQPVLQGVSRFINNLNPQYGGGIGKAVTDVASGIPSSFVPGSLNQIGQLFDNTARSTYDPNAIAEALNKVKGRIPGARTTLQPSVTTLGQPRELYQDRGNNIFNVFFNPAFVKTIKDNEVYNLVKDIQDRSGETQQAPRAADKKIKINGQDKKLSAEEYNRYQTYIGQKTNETFTNLANDTRFNALSDVDKAKYMSGKLTDINAAAKDELFGNKPTSGGDTIKAGELGYETKQPKVKISKPKKVSKGRKGRAPAKGRAAAKGRATSFKIPKFKKVTARKAPASPKAPKVGKVKGFAKLRPTKSARKTIKIKTG